MFGLAGIRLWGVLGAALVVALLFAWALRLDALRADWRGKYLGLQKQTYEVTATIGNAIGNKKLKWRDVGEQVVLVAKSRDAWKSVSGEQTAAIDAMGMETQRLQRLNADLRARADKLIRERGKLINRLERQAMDPGDRSNCAAQLQAVDDALNAVFAEGL